MGMIRSKDNTSQCVVLSRHVTTVIDVPCRGLEQVGVGHCRLWIHHLYTYRYCAPSYNAVAARLMVLFSFTTSYITVRLMATMTG